VWAESARFAAEVAASGDPPEPEIIRFPEGLTPPYGMITTQTCVRGRRNNGMESHAKGSQGVEEGSPSASPLCSTNRVRPGQGCPVDPFGAQARKATASQTWCGSSDKPTGQTSRSGLRLRAAFDPYYLVKQHVAYVPHVGRGLRPEYHWRARDAT
jgi:hypothetical protein